ncbi:MAG: molybdopterin dinucleotide binding domain-containing protein, partial [Inhella sp.]
VRLTPATAARRRLADGELLRLATARGEAVLPLKIDARVAPGQAELAMHWGTEFLSQGVNELTTRERCPQAQQPELKFSALAVEPANLPWRISACAWVPAAEAPGLRERLRALLAEFPFAQCLPAPREIDGERGWAFEAAMAEVPSAALIERISQAVGLSGPGAHQYADPGRGRLRRLRLAGERMQAVLRVGEHEEAAWLLPLWQGRDDVRSLGRWLLAPGQPPVELAAASPQICNCYDVREDAVLDALKRHDGELAAVQAELRCGTQCGSCLPSLRRLASQHGVPA